MKPNLQQIAACIERQIEPEPFSGVVRLTQGDEVVFENGYGLAIRSECISNEANTRFQMASGCKIFTAVAVCQLVERGALQFDSLLSECVDAEFPNFAPEITIRQLLLHSSGITSYFEEDVNPDYEALWQNVPMYRVRRPSDFIALFQHKPMKFPPGERFDYNDGGFILLGRAVERASGQDFPAYIQERIFAPAGMDDSGYFATDQLPKRVAYAYIRNDDGSWRTNIFAVPIVGAPDGGAYTTAPDMASFWNALRANRLLSRGMTTQLLTPQIVTPEKPPCTHYGLGVWIDQSEGVLRKQFVEGFDPGVALRSAVYPAADVTLTILGNTARALWPLYRELEKVLGL